jgi:uroporphyrinogen-III synthase
VASRGTVWITRAQPGASATALRVEALGFTALIDPLLAVAALSPPVDLAGVAALAFTSANGVEAFAALSPARHLPVFTVGDSTARAARAAGFADPLSADGDVEALADLLARERPGVLLCPGAAEPAADLPALLAARGLSARSVAVYAACERATSTETLALLPDLAAVLLHSPRAARAFAKVLAISPAPGLRALCLSPAVAAALEGASTRGQLGPVAFASRPRETDLLDLLAS